jgi:hypothetical protein
LKNKTKHFAIVLILMLTMALVLNLIPYTQSAELELPTIIRVAAAPNPVGVGQAAFLTAFLTKPLPTTAEWVR